MRKLYTLDPYCYVIRKIKFHHMFNIKIKYIMVKLDQYNGIWWPGSLHHHNIRSFDIDYAG